MKKSIDIAAACLPPVMHIKGALDAAFFARGECPWDEVAYPEVNDSIRRAYDDLERGEFGIYQAEMSEDSYRLVEVSTA